MVRFAGEGLVGGSAYLCQFGANITTLAHNTSWDSSFVHCVTPAAVAATVMPQLSLNTLDYTNSSLPYHFYPPPQLYSISPTSGPALGNTVIELSGAEFSPLGTQTICRFGANTQPDLRGFGTLSLLTAADGLAGPHNVTPRAAHPLEPNEVFATLVNSSFARCIAPPATLGLHSNPALELSINGHDFTTDGHLYHYYAAEPTLTR
eukprot:3793089-Prymnesium_polylepis.1